MMATIDLVFPQAECGPSGGMTLRDYFAGQALGHCIPLIMNAAKQMSGAETMELIVAMSYEMADGMLRARGR